MKKTIRLLVSTAMLLVILASIVWYLFIYDRAFTRDTLLQQARFHDTHGNSRISAVFYDMAYIFSEQDQDVAIELANQYKSDGNYTKAEYTLTAALKNNPSVDLYVALCRAFVEQDKLLDAVNLLDSITDPQIKAQIDSLRPTIPNADFAPGYYSQYMDIHLSSVGCKYIFYANDGTYPSTNGLFYQNFISLPAGETTIYAIAVSDAGLVSPLNTLAYTITGVIEEVTFVDSAMEAAVRAQLHLGDSTAIFSNMLWDITSFSVPKGTATLADLEKLPYLQTLTIQDLTMDSLTHLSTLANLQELDLAGSRFSVDELYTLAKLPSLKKLNLSNCGLSTIAGLGEAQSLTHLDLSSNTIRNLDALAPMTTLVEVNLSHNAVTNLSALGSLPNLDTLLLNYNAIDSLEPLSRCVKLSHLEVEHNNLSNLNGVTYLPLLTHLSVDYNTITDVSLLAGCIDLINLSIASNDITDITSLSTLTKLQIFDFSDNQIEELPQWPDGSDLQTIDGSYNALTSIDSLRNMQKLTHIYMDYNLLTNIDALADNYCLVQVNVFGNKIPNVEALRQHDIIVNYDPTVD